MRRPLAAPTSRLSSRLAWLRLGIGVVLLWWVAGMVQSPASWSVLWAQEKNPTLDDVEPAASPPAAGSAPAKPPLKQRTLMDTIIAGGYIGVIIILLSIVAVGFIIEHALTIRKQRIMPDDVLDPLEELIAKGDYQGAIQYCQDPSNYCLATDVILAGLERYTGSEFGFAEYKAAVEEAGEDNTARLYRKTDALSVIGAIAPMLGLFGTVEGMMESFNTIASRGGMARPDELADSIGKALVTTWLGLIVAIPAMVAFSYFRNKIDSLVSECGKRVERILAPLSRKK
ncbi:MAG: MotA/TolQ/ExbB proton channel family protein [Pirellulaceae bacterium]|nr:MotA/TolQ/ExbB proton channel family protein [Pirellulaceae bacterium]